VFLMGRHSLLYTVAAASLILAAVPYRVIFLALKSTDVFVSILAVELVYKLLAYPLRLSSFGQRLQARLAVLCSKQWVESATHTFSTLPEQPESSSIINTASSAPSPDHIDTTPELELATSSVAQSDSEPLTVFRVESSSKSPRSLTLGSGPRGGEAEATLQQTEDPAIELARRFFVHNMVDITAILSVLLLLLFIRRVDSASEIGSMSADDWNVILYHYLIAIAFEFLLIASFSWGMGQFINARFQPFIYGRDLVSHHLALFVALQLVAYLLTFLIADPRNVPSPTALN